MAKQYFMKFKENIEIFKKETILNGNNVIQFMEAFGIYIVVLNDEIMYSLRKDVDILYIKEKKK